MVGLCGLGSASANAPDLASAVVRDTSERMIKTLEARRPDLDSSPGLIYQLVEEIVVPNFDFDRITAFAVGRYWRQASAPQREGLTREFRQMLVRTYAKALLNYSGQEVVFLPLRPGQREGQVTVRTEVRETGGPPIPIDYQMYLKNGAWKVYDISIDGISLVSNYRSSFDAEIRRKGVDGLIESLKDRNAGTQQ